MCATVRIVFQTLYTRGDTVLGASKINVSIMFSVPAAAMTYGNTAMVVTARAALFLGEQWAVWGSAMKLFVHDLDHAATTCRRGLYFKQCHVNLPRKNRIPGRL